ncbi:ABC transporter ATP-binding protein [Ottowia sp. VDI28]|uniref:ABC transporter ATP-binding protein n=1 Tax=Ottowia sp. VDI28 TaxID=3133968 RepID=UPI003C305B46
MAAISIRDLCVDFGGAVLAVDHVSLEIESGQFVAIVGPSGCGKTTILNHLTGLLPVQRGEITIGGEPPRAGSPRVTYTMARDCLFPWRTALDNVCFGMELRGVPQAERVARARRELERVGLGKFADAYPKALSHGMRQRCALARGFCLESEVLLMDEPFGALDAQTKIQLEDLLLELWGQTRRTVVFITHDLAEAVALADRVVVMSARPGRIVADMAIDLPRPRHVRELQRDPAFLSLYSQVWEQLERGIQLSQADAEGAMA